MIQSPELEAVFQRQGLMFWSAGGEAATEQRRDLRKVVLELGAMISSDGMAAARAHDR